jgi:hypothetical protein
MDVDQSFDGFLEKSVSGVRGQEGKEKDSLGGCGPMEFNRLIAVKWLLNHMSKNNMAR